MKTETTGGESIAAAENSYNFETLTEGRVVAQFQIVTLEALLGSPAVVSSFFYNVDFLVAVLANVSTEDPSSAVSAHLVSTVNRAAPHVSDAIGINLRASIWISHKGVIWGDPVRPPTGVTSIYINTKYFTQQSTPGGEKEVR